MSELILLIITIMATIFYFVALPGILRETWRDAKNGDKMALFVLTMNLLIDIFLLLVFGRLIMDVIHLLANQ